MEQDEATIFRDQVEAIVKSLVEVNFPAVERAIEQIESLHREQLRKRTKELNEQLREPVVEDAWVVKLTHNHGDTLETSREVLSEQVIAGGGERVFAYTAVQMYLEMVDKYQKPRKFI